MTARYRPLLLSPILLGPVLFGQAAPATAQVAVATDIAPVHSLVAQVMGNTGTPDLVVPPGSSPHDHNLRPSEARALDTADLVVWIGPDLSPPLARSIETLASNAVILTLMEQPGTRILDTRTTPIFAALEDQDHDDHGEHTDHDDHDDHDDEADHKDHDDHADHDTHEDHHAQDDDGDHKDHDDHAEDDDAHAGHDHGDHDPHVWLDPRNAAAWLPEIAAALSAADPANADVYAANSRAAVTNLAQLETELGDTLASVQGRPYIVFHDAYQYFETRFGLSSAAAISVSDASRPSPARVALIAETAREQGITCVLAEPQFNAGLVTTILGDSGAEARVLDPVGASLTPGPMLYDALLRDMAQALSDCAVPEG